MATISFSLFTSSFNLSPNISHFNNSSRHYRISRKSPATRIFVGDTGGGGGGGGEDDATSGFNPFGFVTDNPSSRSAIQLPESPAEDGNVGQMLYRIEDKGKEFGRYIKSGDLVWFVRETGSPDSRRGTIVFLHGAPTQSYSYRNVMSQMSDSGYHCIAPDWIGFGFSDKPYPKFGFDYTEKEFHDELDKLLEVLGVKAPFLLVVQVRGLRLVNLWLWSMIEYSKMTDRIPLLGEFTSQNAVMAERFIEAGSAYVLKLEKADVYRLPYLSSSGPGFALLEAARRINFREVSTQIATGFASGSWDKPTLVAWGISDKYLPQSVAEEFKKSNPSAVKLKLLEGAGHMPQEDCNQPSQKIPVPRVFRFSQYLRRQTMNAFSVLLTFSLSGEEG
ncbi:hypothetical protein KSS87_003058 [Heliosperma pusillum]|nr:hypothetical protein KSS87_003058 [Heliosperma pusillum]